jgi:hypothetical protein
LAQLVRTSPEALYGEDVLGEEAKLVEVRRGMVLRKLIAFL